MTFKKYSIDDTNTCFQVKELLTGNRYLVVEEFPYSKRLKAKTKAKGSAEEFKKQLEKEHGRFPVGTL